MFKTLIIMTIKYGLHFLFFEMTETDGQNFLAALVPKYRQYK
jgi:hypothetical protein